MTVISLFRAKNSSEHSHRSQYNSHSYGSVAFGTSDGSNSLSGRHASAGTQHFRSGGGRGSHGSRVETGGRITSNGATGRLQRSDYHLHVFLSKGTPASFPGRCRHYLPFQLG